MTPTIQEETIRMIKAAGFKSGRIANVAGISGGCMVTFMAGKPVHAATIRAIRSAVRRLALDVLAEVADD